MSTNPYAQPAEGVAAPAASPEQQKMADYDLAIGPNRDYYLPKFEDLDKGASQLGWHWPAFFVTSWWFLYRKMYGVGVLNLFSPLIALIIFGIFAAVADPSPTVAVVVGLLLLAAPSFLLAMYANALYWRHIKKVIRNVPSTFANQPDKRVARIERNGGTGVGPMIGVMLGVGFLGIGFLGILAAIAIPAYQDYTIRAQVTEGLNLAGSVKAEVAEFYAQNQRWPNQEDLVDHLVSGKYVESVAVVSGSVVITYGEAANQNIKGQALALHPSADQSGDIFWACGNASTPDGLMSSEGPSGSDVPDKYLPSACRSGT
jgi:type IV pilus assembly protein PilA